MSKASARAVGVGEKKCGACHEVKPFRDFSKKKAGLRSACRLCAREQTREWRRKNRKRWLLYNRQNVREWKAKNPERSLGYELKRKKALRELPGGPFSTDRPDYMARVAYFGGRCVYCGDPYVVLDHAIPISRGGTNHAANIRPACQSCNLSKHTKTPAEFLRWLAKNKPLHGIRRRSGRRSSAGSRG